MVKVTIPAPLAQYAAGLREVEVEAATVGEALSALTAMHPDLKNQIFTGEGKLRSFVNLYANDEDIRYLQKEATPLTPGDTVSIVPSIAGGLCRR